MALSTTWTARDDVTWTAGTLADITACATEVGNKLNRGTLGATSTPSSTQVQDWLIRAKQLLHEAIPVDTSRKYVYYATTSGDYRLQPPGDFGALDVSIKDITSNRALVYVPTGQYDMKFPDPSDEASQEPLFFAIKGGKELWLGPPASGSLTLELGYTRVGVDSTATDISYLPEPLRWKLIDYALVEAFEFLGQYDRAQYYEGKFGAGLQISRRAINRRKWRRSNFRAISFIEEHKLRGFQNSPGRR